MKKGLYILMIPSMPDWIKIGFTDKALKREVLSFKPDT